MTLFARLAGCSLAILLATATLAQDVYDDPPPRATEIPTEGFWPTQKMMDRMLDRILDGHGRPLPARRGAGRPVAAVVPGPLPDLPRREPGRDSNPDEPIFRDPAR